MKDNLDAITLLIKLGLVIGKGQGSETGYYISIDKDITKEDYLFLKDVFDNAKKEDEETEV